MKRDIGRKVKVVVMAFLFSFLLISSVSHAKELKVGVVDVEQIYASYGKAKISSGEIQAKKEAKQAELAKKEKDLKALIEDYDKRKVRIKDAEKQEIEKKIRDLRTEITAFMRLSNQNLTTENRQAVQARLNEIAAAIQDYSKKNGFDFIVDKKSLPFFSDALNVSPEIIKILNK